MSCHFIHLLQVSKKCLRSLILYNFYNTDFTHVYSPGAGADSPQGTKSDVNRNFLSLYPFVVSFKREGSPYIACNERHAFFTSGDTIRYKLWSCQNVCEALIYILDNIYIRFGTKLYRQIVDIPMGTNCAPLVADLFLFCYERDYMTSLSGVKQAEY